MGMLSYSQIFFTNLFVNFLLYVNIILKLNVLFSKSTFYIFHNIHWSPTETTQSIHVTIRKTAHIYVQYVKRIYYIYGIVLFLYLNSYF